MMELWETDPTPGSPESILQGFGEARVVMNELTGTAQPPDASSDVWMTANSPQSLSQFGWQQPNCDCSSTTANVTEKK
jgi:hypothetical protein